MTRYSRSTLGLATLVLVLVPLLLLTLGRIGGESGGRSDPGRGETPLSAEGGEGAVVPDDFATDVRTAVGGRQVEEGTLWLRVEATGNAVARREVPITARTRGRILDVPVRESERVESGALLLRIDSVEQGLALRAARSAHLSSEAAYLETTSFDAEHQRLGEVERAERERYARARSQLDQRELDVLRAEMELDATRVRAPFAGWIADLHVVEGGEVLPGTELLTLLDLDPIRIEAHVLESEIGNIREGNRATVRFNAFPSRSLEARVETINPRIGATGSGRVVLSLPNPSGEIKPGMNAVIRFDATGLADRILLPRAALLERDGRTMVFVQEEDRAIWRYITVGAENDEFHEVIEGPATDIVRPGEVVLVFGHHFLRHQAPVEVTIEGGEGERAGGGTGDGGEE